MSKQTINTYPEKELTKKEYVEGVQNGSLMHVFDKTRGKIMMIKRDGYYPEEQLKNLINIEG